MKGRAFTSKVKQFSSPLGRHNGKKIYVCGWPFKSIKDRDHKPADALQADGFAQLRIKIC
jgi:hypothetical protein